MRIFKKFFSPKMVFILGHYEIGSSIRARIDELVEEARLHHFCKRQSDVACKVSIDTDGILRVEAYEIDTENHFLRIKQEQGRQVYICTPGYGAQRTTAIIDGVDYAPSYRGSFLLTKEELLSVQHEGVLALR